MQIEDFSVLQSRYQSLTLAKRAEVVLDDAGPALQAAENVLNKLSQQQHLNQALANIRKNATLIGKMRPSDARNTLLDPSINFIEATQHKLAAWSKTMRRLSLGEAIISADGREFIPGDAPLASAIAGNACISNYLAMVQLIWSELVKINSANAGSYNSVIAETRRCATVLSDYENASAITTSVH